MTEETKKDIFRSWVEKAERHTYPDLDVPWVRPQYARTLIDERIEPFATQHDKLVSQLPWFENGPPDEEWYTPTPKLRRLWKKIDALYAKGFRKVPNPDYDAERAAAWEAKWVRRPYGATTIVVGQSYNPTPPSATLMEGET